MERGMEQGMEQMMEAAASTAATAAREPVLPENSPRVLAPNAAASASNAPRSALSAIDRGLIERSRRLETWNRVLFGTSAAGLAFALLFGLAYFVEINERRNEVDAARKKGAEDVRAEFERSAPVVVPPPAELPPMPTDPAAGGIGAKGAVGPGAAGAPPKDAPAPMGRGSNGGSNDASSGGSNDGSGAVPPRGRRLRDEVPPGVTPPPQPR